MPESGPIESERKFLLAEQPPDLSDSRSAHIRQAYLVSSDVVELRIRFKQPVGGESTSPVMTTKSARAEEDRREYERDYEDAELAELLFQSSQLIIEKRRYKMSVPDPAEPSRSYEWEIDIFEGANAPLRLAELELRTLPPPASLPTWVGQEVTGDPRYYNRYLAEFPYSTWSDA